VSDKHFDVVVLGRSLGAMCLAALLARRDFRVLVLGQGSLPSSYGFRTFALRRRAFSLLTATSPAFKRILAELAQSQVFRRHTVALDPMLSILLPGRRIELPPDIEAFARELDREFAELRRVVDELYAELSRVNAAADAAFEQDLCWPPGTFWERRETNAAAATLPYLGPDDRRPLLADFPPNHPYVEIVAQSAQIASNLSPGSRPLPPFAVARLHGCWTRGLFGVPDGEDEVVDFLAERVASLGGQVMLQERAVGLVVGHRSGHELVLDGHMASVGASFVVSDEGGEALAHLAAGRGIQRRTQRDWPLVTQRAGRFVVSIVVRRDGLPEPLGAEAFLFPRAPGAPPDPHSPVVHLQRCDRMQPADSAAPHGEHALLVAETLLQSPGSLAPAQARSVVLNVVLSHLPFLDRHLLVVDSVHDGLPVWSYESGRRTEVDRIETSGGSRGPEPMPPLVAVEPAGFLDIGGEPLRGPIPRTFLVGKSVLPALGQEGELLSAWGVARIITRSDRRRERMRRDMWSRIELS
jgi:phytoene dehydrogenase-like protein